MGRTDNHHLPVQDRYYQTREISIQLNDLQWLELKRRSRKDTAAPEAFVKRILNHWMDGPKTIPMEAFNRLYPTTKTHLPEHHVLASPYPPIYLQYLDHLIDNLPPVYSMDGRSRRRMIETLVLIYLFDLGDS